MEAHESFHFKRLLPLIVVHPLQIEIELPHLEVLGTVLFSDLVVEVLYFDSGLLRCLRGLAFGRRLFTFLLCSFDFGHALDLNRLVPQYRDNFFLDLANHHEALELLLQAYNSVDIGFESHLSFVTIGRLSQELSHGLQ
jgi:hypothetical protein